jgi:flagellar biosynthesis protein FlhF
MNPDKHEPDTPRVDRALSGFGPTRIFRAETMRDAFARVKESIGPDAVIVASRDLGPTALPSERFEVVAAPPSLKAPAAPLPEPREKRPPTLDAPRTTRSFANRAEDPSDSLEFRNTRESRESQAMSEREERLTQQLRLLEQAVKSLEGQLQQLTEKDRRLRDEIARREQAKAMLDDAPGTAALVAAGLEREVAEIIVERAIRRATPRAGVAVARPPDVADEIGRTIQTTTPLWALERGAVCALIGGAGAGKTTSLLKLAGLARFAHRRTVAIVSTDTQRLGQLAMLEMYTEIMGIPLMAAKDRGDVDRALEHFSEVDLVLIDTPSHNPFDDAQRFQALKPIGGREVRHHLVMPATLSGRIARALVSTYEGPALESLIITRMDESPAPNALLAACLEVEVPVSHFAHGREIPDDIRAADAHEIASTLLRRAS